MIRKPVVAGQFYPAKKEELVQAIEHSFTSRFGPGFPKTKTERKLRAVISPHAGYIFSGPAAAHAFKAIAESKTPTTFVILGVNHMIPLTCSSDEDWETPFGIVKCDKELITKLEKKGIPIENSAHKREHSIEVQLPFLQYISDENIKIAPIMIADAQYSQWGTIISQAVSDLKRDVVYICSSDFTHYGEDYGFIPFEENVEKGMREFDQKAIKFIADLDPKGFLQYCEQTGATICGKYGIATLLQLMQEAKTELLTYYTSGDIRGDYELAVGYAAIIFTS